MNQYANRSLIGGLIGLLGLSFGSCTSDDSGPVWLALRGGELRSGPEPMSHPAIRHSEGGFWVDYRIPGEAWIPWKAEGLYRAARPQGMATEKIHDEIVALIHGADSIPARLDLVRPAHVETLPPGTFGLLRSGIVLHLPESEAPRKETVFSTWYTRDSAAPDCGTVGGTTGRGKTLWPGEDWVHRLNYPPGSSLRFYAVAEGLGLLQDERVRFLVQLDGVELFTHEARADDKARGAWHTLRLPDDKRSGELVFRVSGDPAVTAILAPTIGPAAVGRHGARPWSDERQNLIVFVADTYRADLLSAWGGADDVSPGLNRIVERALSFEQSWSVAAWTLPTHSSMFTGLYPPQHGAVAFDVSISSDLKTIAETLEAEGYRTGAVTDSAFVSRRFNLHQGFEWFQENDPWNLEVTMAGVEDFLSMDDGRPLFLFVHTFRTHSPYRIGLEENRQPLRDLVARVQKETIPFGGDGKLANEDALAQLHELYCEGARGLDAVVAPWIEDIEQRGILSPGTLLFTSDHGEAFGEHGSLGHGGDLWEEQIRVPLFFLGRDIAPGHRQDVASSVDLPRTLAALAGASPIKEWEGRDLLSVENSVAFSFRIDKHSSLVAVRDGKRKVVTPADIEAIRRGEVFGAVDLGENPSEEVLDEQRDWAAALVRKYFGELEHVLKPVRDADQITLPHSKRLALEEIGYTGD